MKIETEEQFRQAADERLGIQWFRITMYSDPKSNAEMAARIREIDQAIDESGFTFDESGNVAKRG